MKRKFFIFSLLVLIFCLILSGCDDMGQVKGVKERGEIKEEPDIIVENEKGENKTLKLEKYIVGVVAGEMNQDWPGNAYGAQAIMARTFALKYMEDNNTDTISDSFSDAQEYAPDRISEEIRAAVADTRGEVVLYNDQYIKGWFHASAGGETTSAKIGLAYSEKEPPYIKSVKSPDDKAPEDIKNWKVIFTEEQLETGLSKMGEDIGDLKRFEVNDKDSTGRAVKFNFSGSEGSLVVKAADYRKQLDPRKLKSIKIDSIKKVDKGYEIAGSGFGHGVGLSQWGAYSLALDNKKPEDIVKYYYNDIKIVKLYD